jgi:LPXTG-motif cell wall-anchored protein
MKKFIIILTLITVPVLLFGHPTNAQEVEDTTTNCANVIVNEIDGCEPVLANECANSSNKLCIITPAISGPATVNTVPSGPDLCVLPDRTKLYQFEVNSEGPGWTRSMLPCGPISEAVISDTSFDNGGQVGGSVNLSPTTNNQSLPETGIKTNIFTLGILAFVIGSILFIVSKNK